MLFLVLFVPAVYIGLGTGALVAAELFINFWTWIIYNPYWFTLPGIVTMFVLGVAGAYTAHRLYTWIGKRYGKGRTFIITPQTAFAPSPAPVPVTATTHTSPPTPTIITSTAPQALPQVVVDEKKQLEQKA